MPIYEYVCEKCEHEFEHLARSMAARNDTVECPKCGSKKTGRKLTVCAVKADSHPSAPARSGHVHSGGCGCGRPHGSCPMQR